LFGDFNQAGWLDKGKPAVPPVKSLPAQGRVMQILRARFINRDELPICDDR
jgi:hypothetical protein